MFQPKNDVTTLLQLASGGDRQAQDDLFRLVEGELRKRAKARMSHERPGHLLQTTLLIDEAFVKLVGNRGANWQNRSHFYRCAAKVMRTILVDDARRRAAGKRGAGNRSVSLDDVPDAVAGPGLDPVTLLGIHEALNNLAVTDPELIPIVELHLFGGWDLKDIAQDVLHLPYGIVKRRWRMAKALLHRQISGDAHDT
jgi:RNA polymerase sigma factor (TIGR02999 family)